MRTIKKLLPAAALIIMLLGVSGCALFNKSSGEKFSKMVTISEAKSLLPYYQMQVSNVIADNTYFINFYFYCVSPERTSMSVNRSDQFFLRFKDGKEYMYNPFMSMTGTKVNEEYYRFTIKIKVSKEDLQYIIDNPLYSVEWIPTMNVYTEMEIPGSKCVDMVKVISSFVFNSELTEAQEAFLLSPQKTIIDESKWDY